MSSNGVGQKATAAPERRRTTDVVGDDVYNYAYRLQNSMSLIDRSDRLLRNDRRSYLR